ncbi:50S ribosomal protein L23 [Methylocaldum szegediense]|uniref:Large ribosomal subunit protein uL23 n=1 Tax=Methylocaldum szegediense TaxID=73780 RepID=A0ABM9I5N3_9GAMM|nr:50S ribosomal protein L23 [Methylocaldum szegediense]CAI8907595.1 50S ribosomal subunit protein L23 [Methylocaldum szegediense]
MRQLRLMNVIEAPIISEKSTAAAEKARQIAFRVKRSASKPEIKKAVELLFKVEVQSVHVLNVSGKVKRSGRFVGKRADWKKAYVKLKPGYDIDLSAG